MKTRQKMICSSKRGIALVVVLGLLAMLVILSTSFVISMRVERMAGRSQAEYAKARNLAMAALTRALVDMESDMASGTYSPFYRGGVRLSSKTASDQCPLNFLNLFCPTDINMTLGQLKWADMVSNGRLVGRYGYVVADVSGYLDANTISNQVRNYGLDPGEVVLPPEINNTIQVQKGKPIQNFIVQDRPRHRYESYLELCVRGTNSLGQQRNFLDVDAEVTNLFTFSYFPVDSYISPLTGKPEHKVIVDPAMANVSEIYDAIKNELPAIDPSFTNNLKDYVTYGFVPNDVMSFGTKPVPMINEVAVSNQYALGYVVTDTGKQLKQYYLTNSYAVAVEVWYPFFKTINQNFDVSVTASYVPGATLPNPGPINLKVNAGGAWTRDKYKVVRFPVLGWKSTAVPYGVPRKVAPTIPLATLRNSRVLISSIEVSQKSDGAIVDRTQNFNLNVGSIANGLGFQNGPTEAKPVLACLGAAANDPRINWNGADIGATKQWDLVDPISPSKKAMSMGTKNPRVTAGDNGKDKDTGMFVRQSSLVTIGELGFLLYNPTKPWQTVRLFDPDASAVGDTDHTERLFDILTLAPTNDVKYGFVNPNSQNTNVLACAFAAARVERYPGAPVTRVTRDEALQVAQLIKRRGMLSGVNNVYANISDVCLRLSAADFGKVPGLNTIFQPSGYDFWQKKSIMRNSIGLLNPRQNLWLIGINGQAVRQGRKSTSSFNPSTDFATSTALAVVLVWRDPYPDASGHHKCFIQYFQWR